MVVVSSMAVMSLTAVMTKQELVVTLVETMSGSGDGIGVVQWCWFRCQR